MAQDLARATAFSQSLGNWLQRAETETPGSQLSIPPSVRAEAERALQAIEDALQPAPQATVERWLGALGALRLSGLFLPCFQGLLGHDAVIQSAIAAPHKAA